MYVIEEAKRVKHDLNLAKVPHCNSQLHEVFTCGNTLLHVG